MDLRIATTILYTHALIRINKNDCFIMSFGDGFKSQEIQKNTHTQNLETGNQ